jgi:hypothetical protein
LEGAADAIYAFAIAAYLNVSFAIVYVRKYFIYLYGRAIIDAIMNWNWFVLFYLSCGSLDFSINNIMPHKDKLRICALLNHGSHVHHGALVINLSDIREPIISILGRGALDIRIVSIDMPSIIYLEEKKYQFGTSSEHLDILYNELIYPFSIKNTNL